MFEVSHDLNRCDVVIVLFVVGVELLCDTLNNGAGMIENGDIFVGVVGVVVGLDGVADAV